LLAQWFHYSDQLFLTQYKNPMKLAAQDSAHILASITAQQKFKIISYAFMHMLSGDPIAKNNINPNIIDQK